MIDYNKNALDVFRLVATLQVFLGHIISHFLMTDPPFDAVYFVRGVPILFVLCGFLAAKSLEGKDTKRWWFSRAVRILPAFWVCIIVNTVIILIIYETKPTFLEAAVYGVTQFCGLNFYTGDWLRGYGTGVPNGVLWTIPVQIQFFILAPFIARFLKKKNNLLWSLGTVLGLTAVSILCEQLSPYLPEIVSKLIGVTVLPYLYFLVLGMVGWYHRDAIIPFLRKYKWIVLVAYVGWKLMEIYLAFPHVLDGVLYNTVTTLLMGALIFAFAFSFNWRMKLDLTYGFYLYHMIFINILLHFGFVSLEPLWKGGLAVLGIAAATVVCAYVSLRFVEKPIAARLLKPKRKDS